jgi:ribosomal protein S19
MGKSKWKGPFVEKSLFTKNLKFNASLKVDTLSRNSTIVPFLVGKQLDIHS